MHRPLLVVACALVALATSATALAARDAEGGAGVTEYVVLYDEAASPEAARAAVSAAGGTIVEENLAVGVATVVSSRPDFIDAVGSQDALDGAARNAPIGQSDPQDRQKADEEELLDVQADNARRGRDRGDHRGNRRNDRRTDPLAHLQWGMAMIGATADGSYREQQGSSKVLVGILDTGVDGSHPDIAANFNRQLSRNFTTDIPLVDGPCEEEPDASCTDPADVDENGHGTHVASIVGSPINGIGVAGVAPKVSIVNLRAGQDSGYFFLQASVDALTYAADNGVDVVNMSYYIDPWLYNCANNPADSPTEQLEQRTIVEATNRALDYAHRRGVALIGASGNSNTDLGNPTFDPTSPDFPPGTEHDRSVDNTCLDMPTEGNNVMSINALGPTKVKADYSNYGVEQSTVAAPGGFFRDYLGTPQNRTPENLILAAYPESLARENGELEPDGTPNTPFVVRDCQRGVCAYYQYLQGTSMASPHAVGVAALIVAEHGRNGRGGLSLDPDRTQDILERTATDTACPEPRLFDYDPYDRPDSYDAFCDGDEDFNGFYGHGIVNAEAAVDDHRGRH